MVNKKYNRVQVVFDAQHKPYLYGAVLRVNGKLENQRWEKPFVISKRMPDGQEVVYGTVKRILGKIVIQIDRLRKFRAETEVRLETVGLDPKNPVLPDSAESEYILDEQENIVEDVLLNVSVNIRILSELFPGKLKRSKVNVYDYDDQFLERVELSDIADLLLHNRYVMVKGEHIVDLISDKRFLIRKPQMGLKFSFLEFITEAEKVAYGITIKDVISRLWALIEKLSAKSTIKDIVFLTQNLYTLGGLVVADSNPITSGPLKTVLDRVASQHVDRMYPNNTAPRSTFIPVSMAFRTPRFKLEPDLDNKEIRTVMQVNGCNEELTMDYKGFLTEVSRASGDAKLLTDSEN